MNFDFVNQSHVSHGEGVSPVLSAVGPCFTHSGVPDSLIAFGGCPVINDFDVLQATGLSAPEFVYPASGHAAILSQATANSAGSTARVIFSGFSYHYIRDQNSDFPPARVEHLYDILNWLQNGVNPPVGLDEPSQLVNRLDLNYPNPFNPTTTIRYYITQRVHVSLRIYNVAGQLVRTLVDEAQSPRTEGFTVVWDGRNDHGGPVSSGVYLYRLVAGGFDATKKMVVLR